MIELLKQPQVIATIGPASREKETIKAMVEAGMSVARLNLSWGTLEEHSQFIDTVRELVAEMGQEVPIMLDLSGPRISTDDGHTFNREVTEVLTEKDKEALAYFADKNCEYVALSYVGSADDISSLREYLESLNLKARVVAKIERMEAVKDIAQIVEGSDAIMVARGDLGDAVPFGTLPQVKEELIIAAHSGNIPAIVATEFMTSMIENDRPTRAEVSDITDTVLDGVDALLLSDETAIGANPALAVSLMSKVIAEAYSRRK